MKKEKLWGKEEHKRERKKERKKGRRKERKKERKEKKGRKKERKKEKQERKEEVLVIVTTHSAIKINLIKVFLIQTKREIFFLTLQDL